MKYNREDSEKAGLRTYAALPGEGDYEVYFDPDIGDLVISTHVNRSHERWSIRPTRNKS